MEPQPMKVRKLIEMYLDKELLLPEMQRKYVWKSTQMRDLLDSLYRDYPSGAILLWEADSLPQIRESAVSSERGSSVGTKKLLLLDGQQRITSLAAIIEGLPIRIKEGGKVKEKIIEIYFNLDHPIKASFDDEESKELIFQVKTRKITNQKNWISVTKLFKEGVSSILKDLRLSYEDPRYDKYNERLNKL